MLKIIINELQQHKHEVQSHIASLEAEVSKIDQALGSLGSITAPGDEIPESVATAPQTAGKKGGMSAAGRARIAAAQRARWARAKAGQPAMVKPAGKRGPSAAGIAKIRAAQKLRWAKYNAQKAKK